MYIVYSVLKFLALWSVKISTHYLFPVVFWFNIQQSFYKINILFLYLPLLLSSCFTMKPVNGKVTRYKNHLPSFDLLTHRTNTPNICANNHSFSHILRNYCEDACDLRDTQIWYCTNLLNTFFLKYSNTSTRWIALPLIRKFCIHVIGRFLLACLYYTLSKF